MFESKEEKAIEKYCRAANYFSAAQIFLQNNFLLKRELKEDDIKPRLLGHWGTAPGINFVYAHISSLIKREKFPAMFVLGPGHGFAALQANLFLEGTLEKYDSKATVDEKGAGYVMKNFSWPYGYPSHSSPVTPGVIVEGGELGYALATSFGAVLDFPDLISFTMIGDGEAETGPTATSWHLSKFLNPATNGAVVPILHLNGYKISGPTIFGRMSDRDLRKLFEGYGYEPFFADTSHSKMAKILRKVYAKVRKIQARSRSGNNALQHFPMIILRTPKGWSGIQELHGKKIEGNCASHQVVTTEAKTNVEELAALKGWLESYRINELFDSKKGLDPELKAIFPEEKYRLGDGWMNYTKKLVKKLNLPNPTKYMEEVETPGVIGSSSMLRVGLYLKDVFKLNKTQRNFRLMSPDETYSNKLQSVFEETSRAFMLPVMSFDKDLSPDGRVMEMLSEHSLLGMLEGYILTGRQGVFASYEAFVQIVSSMTDQYIKFLKVAREVKWRDPVPSLNIILTSSGWRQEHNGFSHQNPGFIGNLLEKQADFVKVFFPPDANTSLAIMDRCLKSQNSINVIVAGKTLEPRWLNAEQAKREVETGIMTWDFASDPDPHVVIAGIGDYLTKESLAAIELAKKMVPEIRLRFVNVMELGAFTLGNCTKSSTCLIFESFFTKNSPVIFNYHGYPEELMPLLFEKQGSRRFRVHGYIENGSTTTTFDMHIRNQTSRYHLAKEIFELAAEEKVISAEKAKKLCAALEVKINAVAGHAKKYGVDTPEIHDWQWGKD
ncbi:MAG: phosphoketolase family protein [bacterium]